MQPVLWIGGSRVERILKKRHSDPLRAANLFQRDRCPGFAFHHLGKNRESNTHDFALLRQTIYGLRQEVFLLS